VSTSLVFHDELIGVLTLYSTEQVVFGDEHRSAIDSVAPQIAQIVKCASDFEKGHGRLDGGLQNLAQVEQFVAAKAT
jgi:GAF domain-containing protein